MAIGEEEKRKMLRARSIGPRMVAYFEMIGIERLADFAGADADEITRRIDAAVGRKHMNRLGVEAIRNLIALADAETRPPL
jgi:nucleotidyltransferase/DNA polymerase involved in DNA repair